MANLIAQRKNNSDEILKGRFIRLKLQEMSEGIREGSNKKMIGFQSSFWNQRRFAISDDTMQYTHLKQHRYVDMRTRIGANGAKHKKKSHAIHNRIVMGNYSQLVKELTVGFTEEIKRQLRNIED